MKIPFRNNKKSKSTYFFFEAAVIKMEPQRKDTIGLLTVTSKAVIYAPINDSAFSKNLKWKHTCIRDIVMLEKSQFEFSMEGSNEKITFQSEQTKKIIKLIKKQQKIVQKSEKNSSNSSSSSSEESEFSDKIGIPMLTETALMIKHENSSEKLCKNSLSPSVSSTSSCKNRALPPEPSQEPEYVNIRKESHLQGKLPTLHENEDFKRYTILPTSKTQYKRSETMQNMSSYSNNSNLMTKTSLPTSYSANNKDDFVNLKEFETEISERRSIIEHSKSVHQNRRPFSVMDVNLEAKCERPKRAKTLRNSTSTYEEDEYSVSYANLPNKGLYANGVCPFESMPVLCDSEYLQYADLDIFRSLSKKSSQNGAHNNFSIYTKIDFVSTNALRMTAEGQV